eukprot:Hpha_TRINITY_DN15772_c1_g4::TRINITY_DN15772_c1_g4_i1::g.41161::m.41161/K18749/LSM14, RAP55, SCD6; protein LSM14
MGDSPQLGQRLALVSKSNIRYEGVLCSIDPEANTVSLQGVRMFGTEDRAAPHFIPPSQELYQYIVFKGRDIKDLTVYNDVAPPAHPADPAIVSAGRPLPRREAKIAGSGGGGVVGESPPRGAAAGGRVGFFDPFGDSQGNRAGGGGGGRRNQQHDMPSYGSYGGHQGGRPQHRRHDYDRHDYQDRDVGRQSYGGYGGYGDSSARVSRGGRAGYGGGGGDYRVDYRSGGGGRGYGRRDGGGGRGRLGGKGGGKGGGGGGRRVRKNAYDSHTGMEFATGGEGEKMTDDFDFEEMNRKLQETDEAAEKPAAAAGGAKYEKKGFFDELTYDDKHEQRTKDRAEAGQTQHDVDIETFGTKDVSEYERRNQGGRKGGRGKGGMRRHR